MPHELSSVNGTPVTVRQVAEKFFFHCWRRYSREALENRRRTLYDFCSVHGTKSVAECTPYLLLDWLAAHPSWRSAHTRRNALNAVNTVFNWAAKMRLIADNPFRGAKVEEEGRQRRSMTSQELRRLCINTDRRFARWLRFLWYTGARPGEASALTWPMIDWEKGQAVLWKHKTSRKTGLPRVILIPKRFLQLLRAMYNRDIRQGMKDGFVFRNSAERPWSRVYTSTKMQRLRPRAGVASDCVPYCARHAFGTLGASLMPIKLVSVCLGHTTTKITERYYTHTSTEQMDAVRGVSEAIEQARRSHHQTAVPTPP